MYSQRKAASTARPAQTARQAEHAEPTNLELDRLTIALLAASDVVTRPREAIRTKRGALTHGGVARTPQRARGGRVAVAAAALAFIAIATATLRGARSGRRRPPARRSAR